MLSKLSAFIVVTSIFVVAGVCWKQLSQSDVDGAIGVVALPGATISPSNLTQPIISAESDHATQLGKTNHAGGKDSKQTTSPSFATLNEVENQRMADRYIAFAYKNQAMTNAEQKVKQEEELGTAAASPFAMGR
jgi:hypothetical protein